MKTTHGMTRKKPRRHNTTESSSSEGTARSKPPKDVLGLGQHLVHELGLEPSVDTLGRWMAHHVAELMGEARTASTPRARRSARKEATETILKIWAQRASLPGAANPLHRFGNALVLLDRLRPDNNPFGGDYFTSRRAQYAAKVFDSVARLVMALLLMEAQRARPTRKLSAAVKDAMDPLELTVLARFLEWEEVFAPLPPRPSRKKQGDGTTVVAKDIQAAALEWTDRAIESLTVLRKELGAPAASAS